jgi:hypothetical protein
MESEMMIETKKMENVIRLMIVERVVLLSQLAECRAGQGRAGQGVSDYGQ